MLGDEEFDEVGQLLLLAAWQAGSFLEDLAQFATRCRDALGTGLAQEFLDRDTQGLGHGDEHVGTGEVPALLPIADVGLVLADLAGQLALGQSSGLPEGFEVGITRVTSLQFNKWLL